MNSFIINILAVLILAFFFKSRHSGYKTSVKNGSAKKETLKTNLQDNGANANHFWNSAEYSGNLPSTLFHITPSYKTKHTSSSS